LVLFAVRTTSRGVELRQRLEPPFLPREKLFGRRRTGEATVPREGKVMRDELSFRRSPARPAAIGAPTFPYFERNLRLAPRASGREFVRTSHAPRARGRRCAARVISHASNPQGSLFLVLFADAGHRAPGELRQRRDRRFSRRPMTGVGGEPVRLPCPVRGR
jgi:hypothetical protein